MKKMIIMLMLFMFIFAACSNDVTNGENKNGNNNGKNEENKVVFHFLNVSQLNTFQGSADCTIIEDNGIITVIDAGTSFLESRSKIGKYLNDLNVDKIDHLILTHAHRDHAGGMIYLINNFDIGTYYAKPVDWSLLRASEETAGTQRFYDDIIDAISSKENSDGTTPVFIEPVSEGHKVIITENSYFEIYNCTDIFANQYKDQDYNQFSFAIKYGTEFENVFIGGDSTSLSDDFIIGNVGECAIFRVQHHGTSGIYNSQNLFNELKPSYVIISGISSNVGYDIVQRSTASGAELMITGNVGNIVVTLSEKGIKLEKEFI